MPCGDRLLHRSPRCAGVSLPRFAAGATSPERTPSHAAGGYGRGGDQQSDFFSPARCFAWRFSPLRRSPKSRCGPRPSSARISVHGLFSRSRPAATSHKGRWPRTGLRRPWVGRSLRLRRCARQRSGELDRRGRLGRQDLVHHGVPGCGAGPERAGGENLLERRAGLLSHLPLRAARRPGAERSRRGRQGRRRRLQRLDPAVDAGLLELPNEPCRLPGLEPRWQRNAAVRAEVELEAAVAAELQQARDRHGVGCRA